MRRISNRFMDDLINPEGMLHPILIRVKKRPYINAGNSRKLHQYLLSWWKYPHAQGHKKGFYQASFDDQYNKSELHIPDSPNEINHQNEARSWIDSFPSRKNIMDEFFST